MNMVHDNQPFSKVLPCSRMAVWSIHTKYCHKLVCEYRYLVLVQYRRMVSLRKRPECNHIVSIDVKAHCIL